jgi:hypothetical protein
MRNAILQRTKSIFDPLAICVTGGIDSARSIGSARPAKTSLREWVRQLRCWPASSFSPTLHWPRQKGCAMARAANGSAPRG